MHSQAKQQLKLSLRGTDDDMELVERGEMTYLERCIPNVSNAL